MIIHINGWPGSGKKTVGELLAKNLGARFIHNHMLHDVAIVCAGFDGADRWPLYEIVRTAAYEVLAKRPKSESFVMTNALCKNSSREQQAWRHVVDLAIARQVPLVPIVLQCDVEENCRRLQSAERIGMKLTDAEELKSYFDIDTIQMPDVPELLVLDVTLVSPEGAAKEIFAHVASIRDTLQPASLKHLRMR